MWYLIQCVPRAVWLFAVGVVLIAGMHVRMKALEQEVTQGVFVRDSIEAFHSQTVLRIVGQRKLATRQVVQTTLERDSLNKALKTVARLRSRATVAVDKQSGSTVASINIDTSFSFHEYKAPYDLSANVRVQPDGTTAKLNWEVRQDKFRLGARVDCSEKDDHGVRSAYLTLDLPVYMAASVDSVSQSKEVCSGSAGARNNGISRTRAYAEAVGIAGGTFLAAKAILKLLKGK